MEAYIAKSMTVFTRFLLRGGAALCYWGHPTPMKFCRSCRYLLFISYADPIKQWSGPRWWFCLASPQSYFSWEVFDHTMLDVTDPIGCSLLLALVTCAIKYHHPCFLLIKRYSYWAHHFLTKNQFTIIMDFMRKNSNRPRMNCTNCPEWLCIMFSLEAVDRPRFPHILHS